MSMKMGVALILNEETEELFRSKTIDEMKEISSKFSWSIGETRRELRTTVGERYRDLLSAAETIVKMNEEISLLSCSLTSLVADVEKISLSPSFRRDTTPTGATGLQEISPSNLPYLNVASQIKLLRLAHSPFS
uniref:Conserved oligomeric Golgi complex subunit 1 n=1 Tax=Lepeophtheirus salmonis TaxID=72036 RepID=C1BRV5_LEPSM|nr:conserved oligomeric Golgi complex component 1 [Lepeophtheirus salmonis]